MKTQIKILSILLGILMVLAVCPMTAFMAETQANVTLEVEKTEVEIGDTFTVTLSNKAMTVKGFSAGFTFDNTLLECVSIVGADPAFPDDYSLILKDGGRNPYVTPTAVSSVAQANANGTVGYAYIGTTDAEYVENVLFIVTFRAKTAGVANFTLYEETNGTDAFDSDSIETQTITINTLGVNANVTFEVEKTGVEIGDTFTVTLSNKAMTVKGFSAGFTFDNTLLECVSIVGADPAFPNDYSLILKDGGRNPYVTPTAVSSVAQANANGTVGYAYIGTADTEYVENVLFIVTFRAKTTGVASFTLYEESNGTNAVDSDNIETKTVSISALGNVAFEIEKTEVEVGEVFTVTFSNKAMIVKGFSAGFTFDNTLLECVSIVGADPAFPDDYSLILKDGGRNPYVTPTAVSSVAQANANGTVGYAYIGTTDAEYVENVLFIVTFRAKAAGVASFTLYEETNGTDAFDSDSIETKVVTVNGSEPACTHETTKAVSNGNGTHNIVCANDACGEIVTENVSCTFDGDYTCVCGAKFTGWDGKNYVENGEKLSGWNKVENDWYYFGNNGYVTGLTRVPYPTVAINGVTYEPNAADLAYWEAHKDTSKYSDATTALFVFDENGKFVQNSGIVGGNKYAVDGCVAWHVGFVKVDNDYYYFVGDKVNGGNVMATGKVYATRDVNSDKPIEGTTIYYFGDDGKLLKNEGIVEISGELYYFDSDNKLALGKGLTQVEGGYIYVRSGGQLAIGTYYANGVKYEFDENGFTKGAKNGIVDGGFYENGHRKFGLIEYNGDVYYFRTKGGFATGEYYISNTNGLDGFSAGDLLIFDEDGKLLETKNGIVEEDGVLCYYKNNHLQSGAGVVEMTDEHGETYYIYVRSNGQLATGKYWPSTRNGLLESGEYDWGTDGKYYPGK